MRRSFRLGDLVPFAFLPVTVVPLARRAGASAEPSRSGPPGPAPSGRPVVVVAGLLQAVGTVAPLARSLRDRGLDVTIWVPPGLGLGDIDRSAAALGRTVAEVRERTGADRVDLVGHSEGGVTARWYVKFGGGVDTVHTLVSLGSPQQGTAGGALSLLMLVYGIELWSPACRQLVAGSGFLKALNGDDPTPGPVRYVTVGSAQDGVVQPVGRAGIPGAENVVVGEECPGRTVGHFGLLSDGWVHELVASVLDGGPATADDAARPVGCRI